jgi:hypothetical protein
LKRDDGCRDDDNKAATNLYEKMKSIKSGSWKDVKLELEMEAHVKIGS